MPAFWTASFQSLAKSLPGGKAMAQTWVPSWVGMFKARLTQPRVSTKFEFRYESLKSKFSLILFVYNLMIGYSK